MSYMKKKRATKREIIQRNAILYDLYVMQSLSCQQIYDKHNMGISVRQMQRSLKKMGVVRTQGDSFRLAVSQGRVKYHKTPEHLKQRRKYISTKDRYKILERDGFKCVQCGNTAGDDRRLEVDHINNDPRDNDPSNLQTLCSACNLGKHLNL